MNAENIPEVEKLFTPETGLRMALDLEDLTLVDRDSVRFLADREMDGTALRNCPLYIREWIERERDCEREKL
jgi:hypothetical protein